MPRNGTYSDPMCYTSQREWTEESGDESDVKWTWNGKRGKFGRTTAKYWNPTSPAKKLIGDGTERRNSARNKNCANSGAEAGEPERGSKDEVKTGTDSDSNEDGKANIDATIAIKHSQTAVKSGRRPQDIRKDDRNVTDNDRVTVTKRVSEATKTTTQQEAKSKECNCSLSKGSTLYLQKRGSMSEGYSVGHRYLEGKDRELSSENNNVIPLEYMSAMAPRKSSQLVYAKVLFGSKQTYGLIDTAATRNFVSRESRLITGKEEIESTENVDLQLGDGTVRHERIENVIVQITFFGHRITAVFAIINSSHSVILGLPFLEKIKLCVDFANQSLNFEIQGQYDQKPYARGHYVGKRCICAKLEI